MTATIEYADETELVAKLNAIASTLGYHFVKWQNPETPQEFCRRVGIRNPATFTRLTRHPLCPPFAHVTGKSGRIRALCANHELIEYFKKHRRKP